MYAVIWDYVVRTEAVDAFMEAYAVGGAWTQLFARGDGYLGSELFRSADEPERFLTIDRWKSREAFTDFMIKFGSAYAALDKRFEGLTTLERRLGDISE